MRRLIRKLEEMGYSGASLAEWLPVYGWVFGVLTAKRALKLQDLRQLSDSAINLENEIGAAREKRNERREDLRVPRVLNKFLWLLDWYAGQDDPSGKAALEQTRLRIRMVAPDFYERYFV
jgi:hypothetical protein